MKKTLMLLAMVAALVILPFFINHGGEYGGSDGEAESQIQAIAPHYKPGSSRCMNPPVVKLKVCFSPFRVPSAQR